MSFNCSFLNNSDYTIIIYEQRKSGKSYNYFLQGDSNLFLGYYGDTSVIHSQSGSSPQANTNSYSASISAYAGGVPRQIIFTSSSSGGKKIYINGNLASTSNDTTPISGLTNCYIGKSYNGFIGEIAIYNKALN